MSAEDCPKCHCVMDECECESGAYEDYIDAIHETSIEEGEIFQNWLKSDAGELFRRDIDQ